jgi:hypothetical protein
MIITIILINIDMYIYIINVLILIAVVLANGGLLRTTGHYLLIFCIKAKQDGINRKIFL